MRTSRWGVIAPCCALLAACATPGPKLVEDLAPISTGLEQAKQQADLTFVNANERARDLDVARVRDNNPPNLVEADFPQAIRLEDRKKWANAFSVLQAYTRNLQNLVDPSRADATRANLVALANELNNGAVQASLPKTAISGFSELAKVLVQLRAERTAQEIMRRTDPAFRDTLMGMSDAIETPDSMGLRFTTRSYWESALADLRVKYADARSQKNSDPAKREAVARQFVEAMDERDAQLASLGTLSDSLAALAEAHHAASYGNQGDALFWIQRISTWLEEAKADSAAKKGGAK